jgi:hypothetical protein
MEEDMRLGEIGDTVRDCDAKPVRDDNRHVTMRIQQREQQSGDGDLGLREG